MPSNVNLDMRFPTARIPCVVNTTATINVNTPQNPETTREMTIRAVMGSTFSGVL
ncbi:MAG TPA: hypothetical protein PK402_11250 [Tepidisphaeraceae bacterium]|nr:hypothetical protein [Tepidisphaeraceae bacterium]